ncbi:hypothetical protein PBI_DONOVAN_41 [Mycobacterium phage Donovan]|uniref:Uncharacterized protein n=1 Tax=Mycobacterium phage Donovan TaxID=1429793 RepID=W0LNN8_9CAUD|nr:hypothetical protein PBI_DONOVAN_41 [Mycobacterium phage Donovan]AHG23745.1 hypothetical protein PBI_DONOVAN_41 [Mycobacterium phage Donovan]WRQ08426.1 hypothetical protein JDBV10_00085 [Mycobacterium phage juyeon]
MMRRSKGRHWPAEGRPSVYAIRHRLHNEFRTTGRFLCGAEIWERRGQEYLVFKNLTIEDPTINSELIDAAVGTAAPTRRTGELPAIGGAQ